MMKKLTWYHELGFFNNPFSIKPAAFHNELMGYDKTVKDIIEKVNSQGMALIKGSYGTGKTTILKRVIDEFRGQKRVIYYNCNQSERSIDLDRLLTGAGGFFSKLFGMRKKNMILLLDEAQDMNKKDMKQVREYYDGNFFRSVVFVSAEDIKLTKELEELIGKNVFNTSSIDKKDAVRMVRERIGNLKLISDKAIMSIFKKDENPRAFLRNCEDACRYAFEGGDKSVAEKHIQML